MKRGKEHTYLGMKLVFDDNKGIKIDMKDYVRDMINDYPDELSGKSKTPANEKIFKVNEKIQKLKKEKAELFHTMVAKGLVLSKRSCPDIQMTIAFCVQESENQQWKIGTNYIVYWII